MSLTLRSVYLTVALRSCCSRRMMTPWNGTMSSMIASPASAGGPIARMSNATATTIWAANDQRK